MIAKRILFVLTIACLFTLTAPFAWAQSTEDETAAEKESSRTSLHDARSQQRKAIAGKWEVVANPINPPPGFPTEFRALHTFTEDGRFIETSANNPVGAGGARGEWRYEGGRKYSVTFLFYVFDPTGKHAVTIRVRTLLTLNRKGDEWSGPFRFDLMTPDGHLLQTGEGSHRAKRVEILPM